MNKYLNIYLLFTLYFLLSFCENYAQLYPTDITGLQCWYAADSMVTLNGAKVFKIEDLSPNHFDITQSISSAQPTLLYNQLNGKPSINFDAIDDYLPISDSVNFKTIIIIAKAGENLFSDYRGLIGGNLPSLQPGGYLINANYGTTNLGQGVNTNNFSKIYHNNIDVTPSGNFSPIDDFWYGVFVFSSNRKQPADIGRIDNGTSPGRYWKGDILELIAYDKQLNYSDSSIIDNYLSKKYSPKITLGPDLFVPVNTSCTPQFSVSISVQNALIFNNYSWSNGANTSQININQYGEYSVIGFDKFGIKWYDTINIKPTLSNFHIPSSFLCLNDTLKWDTELNHTDYTFIWQNNSSDSTFIITQPGQYYVTINDLNCGYSYKSDTITITQDNFPTTASLGPDTSLCAGNRIGLVNGNQAGLSYLWNNNATDSALVINTSGQYNVTITNQNNCVAKDTINVTISGQAPIAGFESTPACLNTSIQFTDTSIVSDGSNINQWLWNFGNTTTLTDTSILSNPTYTFADTGSYQITLFVKSTQGCSQSIQKNIRVYPKPIVDYFSSIACQNDTTSFFSTINSLGYPTSTITWNFGDPSSGNNNQSSLSNSTHIFSQTGNYQVKLIAENNMQCKDSISKTISVKNEVSANFNISTACVGTPITFTDNSIVPAPNTQNVRLWNFYPGSSGGLSVNKTYSSAGTYSVTLTVNGFNGCISSITKNVEVHLPPIADFLSDTICKNDTVIFQDLSIPQQGNLSSWQWKLNNQLISQAQQPTYTFNSSGNFNLKLITQNSFGCKDSISKNSTVYSLPNATISSNTDPYYFIGEPIQFNTSSTNFSSYFWVIDSTTIFTIPQPNFTFNSSGDFSIQVTVEDSLGCLSTGNKTVSVSARLLDLSVKNSLATIDTFGFVKVIAELYNLGTSPITSFEIMYEITGSEKIKEVWTGLLPPNSIMQYAFNRQEFLEEYLQKNALNCIRVLSVNSIQDANLNNNQYCSSLINSENFVADPYPNPGRNKFNIPLNLKDAQLIQCEVKDVLGKKLVSEKISCTKGINLIQLHSEKWENGVYFLSIQLNEKELFLKKLIKN